MIKNVYKFNYCLVKIYFIKIVLKYFIKIKNVYKFNYYLVKIYSLQICLIQFNQSTTFYLNNDNQDVIKGFIVE